VIALLEARRAGLLQGPGLMTDVIAGVVVGIVAMPLAMAFAIASGASPAQGLYTAIVAGLTTAVLGGTRVQISGPTGAFIAVLASITAQYGVVGLQIATLIAGVILIAMGLGRLGGVIRFIPHPVIVGFTSGIAVIIFVGQWKDFFGLSPGPAGSHFHTKLGALLSAWTTLDAPTTAIGLLTLVCLIVGHRFLPRARALRHLPAPLVAMLLATAVQAIGRFPTVATIGTAFGGIPRSLPTPHWPPINLSMLVTLVGPAFTIALLGAIESLLTAIVADGMAGTRHDPNQELVGQGAANLLAPLFGGFAATGAIARTATNIRNGARSPIAGIVHALFLVMVIVVLAPWASAIPLSALSAILFFVAWNMSDLPHVAALLRTAPPSDKALLLITFVLTVFVDLVVAVNVGVVLAALLFMQRMSATVQVEKQTPVDSADWPADVRLPADTLVYRIDGPFFFGAAEKLERTLERLDLDVRTVVLRFGRVPFIDATGLATLQQMVRRFRKREVRVLFCGLHVGVLPTIEAAGLSAELGRQNICQNLLEVAARLNAAPTAST
jgi:sulfate permease, SulP family